MNICRTLPEVPQTFARSSCGWLFGFGAPGFGFGTSDPGYRNTGKDEQKYQPVFPLVFSGSHVTQSQVY